MQQQENFPATKTQRSGKFRVPAELDMPRFSCKVLALTFSLPHLTLYICLNCLAHIGKSKCKVSYSVYISLKTFNTIKKVALAMLWNCKYNYDRISASHSCVIVNYYPTCTQEHTHVNTHKHPLSYTKIYASPRMYVLQCICLPSHDTLVCIPWDERKGRRSRKHNTSC